MNEGTICVIHVERAARAALLPLRTEHEVIHNELASALKELGKRHLAPRSVEDIGLFYFHPGQFAPFRSQRIPLPCQRFLLRQQLLARRQPLSLGNYSWMF